MISKRTKYALKALINLGRRSQAEPVLIADLADDEMIPKKFLEKIIQDLIRSGLVKSHRGAHGGYTLARTPEGVSFRDIIESVEGPISLNVCVTEQHDCSVIASCNMQRIWQEGQRRLLEFFADTTLADLTPVFPSNTGMGADVQIHNVRSLPDA